MEEKEEAIIDKQTNEIDRGDPREVFTSNNILAFLAVI